MNTLNLGILAHVDAGKTTLTERLLYTAGVIDNVGSVDDGTTQTDSLELEQQRGITIRAAVVGFRVGDVDVNIIDTPGHPDFIAEVDRSLRALDAAVLVISAVEGVQAQTVVLLRALRRLAVPTLIFVNKVDRVGAAPERVVTQIRDRLSQHVVAMGLVHDAGTPSAEFIPYPPDDVVFGDVLVEVLVDHDEELLASVVQTDHPLPPNVLRAKLKDQIAHVQVHPVLFGSAATGAGITSLMGALTSLLPVADGDPEGRVSGLVFKVERGPSQATIAYVRLFSGAIRVRDRLRVGSAGDASVTAITVVGSDQRSGRDTAQAGQIAKVSGLHHVQVGDVIGHDGGQGITTAFPPPVIETVISATDPERTAALHTALTQLAELDPLINLRQDDIGLRGATTTQLRLSLYGDVQREVIAQTLAADHGIEVAFSDTTTICIERPIGSGRATDRLGDPDNPFLATLGLRVQPGPTNSGIALNITAPVGDLPLYVYKTPDAFAEAMTAYVTDTFRQGLSGWAVTDCLVTVTAAGYTSPETTAADFRKLTPLAAMVALRQAGTDVCEPIHRFDLEAPLDTISAVMGLLGQVRATPGPPTMTDSRCLIAGEIPAAELVGLQRYLAGVTRGEGIVEARFVRYAPVTGRRPTRPRSDNNPLNRREYVLRVNRRV